MNKSKIRILIEFSKCVKENIESLASDANRFGSLYCFIFIIFFINKFYGGDNMQQLIISNGKVWEKANLHLKSAIPQFQKRNIADNIELDLLREMMQ